MHHSKSNYEQRTSHSVADPPDCQEVPVVVHASRSNAGDNLRRPANNCTRASSRLRKRLGVLLTGVGYVTRSLCLTRADAGNAGDIVRVHEVIRMQITHGLHTITRPNRHWVVPTTPHHPAAAAFASVRCSVRCGLNARTRAVVYEERATEPLEMG